MKKRMSPHGSALDRQTDVVLERAQQAVKEHRANDARREAREQQPWRWIFAAITGITIAAVLVWPSGTLASRLHTIVRGICDQKNNLDSGPQLLPFDARCTGLYTGFLATLLYLLALGRARAAQFPPLRITLVLLAATVLLGIDGINSVLNSVGKGIYPSHNALRLATGLFAGSTWAVFGLPLFNGVLRSEPLKHARVINTWLEVLGGLVVLIGLGLVAWYLPQQVFYLLALFSVVGMAIVVFMLNVSVAALLMGKQRRVFLLAQLARPAAISVVLTAVELGMFAWLRAITETVGIFVQRVV